MTRHACSCAVTIRNPPSADSKSGSRPQITSTPLPTVRLISVLTRYTAKGDAFVAERPRVWVETELANVGLSINFHLAPDQKRFLVTMPLESTEPPETRSHLTLVANFFDEVRRRAARR